MTDADLKQDLVDIATELYQVGVVTGTGGNISVRSSEHENSLWITPRALFKGGLNPIDLTLIDLEGKMLEGKYKPSIEFAFHAGLMKFRPDINAVVHSHAPYAIIWGLGDLAIPPITHDALLVACLPFIPWHMVGSKELAEAVLETVGRGMTCGAFLRNHGLVTVGGNLRQAADETLMVEHTLKILHHAHQLGFKPAELTKKAMEQLSRLQVPHDR
jgi:L-fuculose-phosphate aldolase